MACVFLPLLLVLVFVLGLVDGWWLERCWLRAGFDGFGDEELLVVVDVEPELELEVEVEVEVEPELEVDVGVLDELDVVELELEGEVELVLVVDVLVLDVGHDSVAFVTVP